MHRAAMYLRRSTSKQEASLQDQEATIQRYASEQGVEVVARYCDDAISGADATKRPDFIRMIDDAGAGGFEAILIQRKDNGRHRGRLVRGALGIVPLAELDDGGNVSSHGQDWLPDEDSNLEPSG